MSHIYEFCEPPHPARVEFEHASKENQPIPERYNAVLTNLVRRFELQRADALRWRTHAAKLEAKLDANNSEIARLEVKLDANNSEIARLISTLSLRRTV